MIVSKALDSDYCIFSIVGPHSGESLDSILERKKTDIINGKIAFWNMNLSKNFINDIRKTLGKRQCYVIMLEGSSNDTKGRDIAKSYSVDNLNWNEIPSDISKVSGNLSNSATAFVYNNLEIVDNKSVDLNFYNEVSDTSKAVKFSNFKSTVFAKKRKNKRSDGMKNHERNIIGVLGIEYPYAVYLR